MLDGHRFNDDGTAIDCHASENSLCKFTLPPECQLEDIDLKNGTCLSTLVRDGSHPAHKLIPVDDLESCWVTEYMINPMDDLRELALDENEQQVIPGKEVKLVFSNYDESWMWHYES